MSRAKTDQRFAPVPLRALWDLRLGRLHLCVLGIIAAFDRLGKNGSGCWASQNKIAEIAGVDKTRLSHSLSDLRDFGFISSEMNPTKRRSRVHRVIYTDEDSRFWDVGKSVAPHDNYSGKSVAPHDNYSGKSVAPHDNYSGKVVAESEPDSCGFEQNKLRGTPEKTNETNDLQNTTIVRDYNKTIEETAGGFLKGQDRAEARNRSMSASEAEAYLTNCEREPVERLVFERKQLERLANDPCLPEELNDRASRLLLRL